MSTDVRDLRDTIIPKSDQLNADQLLGGPITITVTDVRRGSGDDQPVVIHYEGEGGRPYKPCKSMRRVLMFAWGNDGSDWVGRSMTLYNRLDVKFGGQEVGGIRISHLSHIDRDIQISLTQTRGKKEQTRIEKLLVTDPVADARSRLAAAARGGMESLKATWGALPADHKRAIGGSQGCPDDLKRIAREADAASKQQDSEPPVTSPAAQAVDGVLSAIESAADIDALDTAYDLARDLDPVDRERVTEAYNLRRDALDLA